MPHQPTASATPLSAAEQQRSLVADLAVRLRALGLAVTTAEYASAPAVAVLGTDGGALVVGPLFHWALGEEDEVDADVWEVALRNGAGEFVEVEGEPPFGCPSIWHSVSVGSDLDGGVRFVTEALALVENRFAPASLRHRVGDFPALPYPGARPGTSWIQTADDDVLPVLPDLDASSGFSVVTESGLACLDDWLAQHGAAPMSDRVPVLSYGSNACPEKVRANGVRLPAVHLRCATEDLAAVWCAGTRRDGAVPATLTTMPGHREDHVLSYLLPEDFRRLDVVEGRPTHYDLVTLTEGRIIREDGARVTHVFTYVGVNVTRWPTPGPTGGPVLLQGSSQAEAMALLARAVAPEPPAPVGVSVPIGQPPTASGVRHVFVYGTLMPGQPRWPLLAPYAVSEPRPAATKGQLYDSGLGYPALFAGEGDVPGYLVELDLGQADEAVALLDRVEGTSQGLFARHLARIDGVTAWTYHGADPRLRGTPINRWIPEAGLEVAGRS